MPFRILIQSSGGYVGDGVAIHNYLKSLPIEIVTYNAGYVSSIAVIIFLGGKVRKASPYATFMIHKSTHTFSGANAETLRTKAYSAELDDRNTEAILHAYLNMPQDKWDLHGRGDLHLSAEVSKEYGLVHEISNFIVPDGSQIFNI